MFTYNMQIFNGNLEEDILRILLRGFPLRTTDLLHVLSKKSLAATKQGMYRVLRKLKREEKILIFKHTIVLNNLWLFELRQLIGDVFAESIVGDIEHLQRGRKISIHLHNLMQMDQVWTHIFTNIERNTSAVHPLYLYNPHNWTAIVRKEIDQAHAAQMGKKKRRIYLLIGGNTLLDRLVAKDMFFPQYECMLHGGMLYPNYVAVIGHYIIIVHLLHRGNDLISRVFTEETEVVSAREKLLSLDKKISARIVIEHNAAKAKTWKKRITKDFFVPLKYRDW